MPKPRSLEDALAALQALRAAGPSPAALAALRDALRDKVSHVVAKAATIAGEWEARELGSDLAAAFPRFLDNPGNTDKGCAAKHAIAEALYRIGYEHESVFRQGIRHVQREPVYGGSVDTAAELRATCALGLVRMNYPEALAEIADLLADPEPAARAGAARALGYRELDDALPLLRFKARLGDPDAQVLAEVYGAMLKVAPRASLPRVGEYLHARDPAVQEAAALALGGSRLAGAFELLRAWWEKTLDADLRNLALRAIAMLRQEEALAFLLQLVREGPERTARAALAALAMHRYDASLVQRVRAAARRDDVDLREAVEEAFA
jgi:HEAT repeat protein